MKTVSGQEMIIDDTHLLDGKTWFDLKPTMVYVPSDSWAKIKAFIIKSCKNNNNCKQISSWERSINAIDEKR